MTGPVLTILVPGVGMWPGVFDPVAAAIPGPTEVWVRPGYDDRPPADDLAGQVRALAAHVAARAPARVVGVSGGATLALALALPPHGDPDPALRASGETGDTGLVGIVTHEPLVGPLRPDLAARVSEAGRRLADEPGPGVADDFLTGLYGADSLARLPAEAREWSGRHHRTVCREVAHFAAFAPTRDELAAITVPHVTTVGRRSGPERLGVAELLGGLGAEVRTIGDCGHLAPVDAPDRLARIVGETAPAGTAS